MDKNTRVLVTLAAILASLSFVVLLVGVPLVLNDIASLESEAASQHSHYMVMSNRMWDTLMEEGELTRLQIAEYGTEQRHKRQCGVVASIDDNS